MASYEMHAWEDAVSMAVRIHELVGTSRAHQTYARVAEDVIVDYEVQMRAEIANFILRTESQRDVVIRRLPDEVTKVVFLVLCIIGCLRAKKLMELRDRYRELLAPGRGNRETTSAIYMFYSEISKSSVYEWPNDVFDCLSDYIGENIHDEPDGSEDGAAARAPLPADLKPKLPPPPEPDLKVTYLLATFGLTDEVKSSSGGMAWKLQFVVPEHNFVGLIILEKPPNKSILKKMLVGASILEFRRGIKPTFVLLPEKERELVEEINAEEGKSAVGLMRKGVTSSKFMRWPDELLRSLRRELELVGEIMPHAGLLMNELNDSSYTMLSTHFGDAEGLWKDHRLGLEKLVKTILARRGRWIGPIKVKVVVNHYDEGPVRDIQKAKRTVADLLNCERTPLGNGLLAILQAVLRWRSDEIDAATAMREAAHAYFDFQLQDIPLHGHTANELDVQLDELIGEGSAEADLVNAGIMRILAEPFYTGSPYVKVSKRLEVPFGRKVTGWIRAWWCVIEVDDPLDGIRGLLPPALELGRLAANVLEGDEIKFRVSDEWSLVSPNIFPYESNWLSPRTSFTRKHIRELGMFLRGFNDSFAPFPSHQAKPDGHKVWGALMVANGPSREGVEEALNKWSQLESSMIQEALRARARKSKTKLAQAQAECKFRVASQAEDLAAQTCSKVERLALMAGKSWDSERQAAV